MNSANNLLIKTPTTMIKPQNYSNIRISDDFKPIITKEESTNDTLSYTNSNQIDPSIYPTLQNVVSTVNLSCSLELKKIALQCRNAEYNPKRFAAVIMRLRDPKTTALIFHSGKIVCTGAKDENASQVAAKKYARMIQKLGFDVKFKDFKIQNIVGSCDVKFPIKLDLLCQKHHEFTQYEPEIFPGLIYRMLTPKIVLLIFVSGKLVLTGAKEKKEIDHAFENIYHVLKECKKQELNR